MSKETDNMFLKDGMGSVWRMSKETYDMSKEAYVMSK